MDFKLITLEKSRICSATLTGRKQNFKIKCWWSFLFSKLNYQMFFVVEKHEIEVPFTDISSKKTNFLSPFNIASVLGFVWLILQPIMQLTAHSARSRVLKVGYVYRVWWYNSVLTRVSQYDTYRNITKVCTRTIFLVF